MVTPNDIAQKLIQIEIELNAVTKSLKVNNPNLEHLKKNQEEYCLALESGYLEIAFMSKIDFSNYACLPLSVQFEAYKNMGKDLYSEIKKQFNNKSASLKQN